MMTRALPLIGLAALLAACRESHPDSAQQQEGRTASIYTTDSTGAHPEEGVAYTHGGAQLEAPRIIPAVRTQLDRMAKQPDAWTEENRTAHKNIMADLINAMGADLMRAGYADSGAFKMLSDSIMNDIGGGTGPAQGPDPEKRTQHVASVRRLIGMYESWMAQAGESKQ
jgi:hypothetical protein